MSGVHARRADRIFEAFIERESWWLLFVRALAQAPWCRGAFASPAPSMKPHGCETIPCNCNGFGAEQWAETRGRVRHRPLRRLSLHA